ncbi:MAG: hypothetical protein IIB87_05035 [Chloroflexi bacterium]|nr:hypothetical protein [Chloroflexota bacterium]
MPLTSGVFSSGDTHLQVFVNGETLSPRQPVTTVAYALVAQQAAAASSHERSGRCDRGVRTIGRFRQHFPTHPADTVNGAISPRRTARVASWASRKRVV